MKTHTSCVLMEPYHASRKVAGLFVQLLCQRAMRVLQSTLRKRIVYVPNVQYFP